MAQRPVPAWRDLRLGVFFLVSTAIFFWFLLAVGTNKEFLVRSYPLRLHLINAQGLSKGDMVAVSGMKAGTVKDVRFARTDTTNVVEVLLSVHRDQRERITASSTVTIRTSGVMGDKFIDVSLGDPSEPPLPDMAVIPTVAQVDWTATFKRASDALDSMVNFAEDASLAMRRLNTGDGALSALLNDPETAAELRDLAHNLAALSRELRSGDGTAARLLSQPETYDQISSVLARLERITASADSGSGTIARLLSDPDLGARIDSLVAGSDDLVSSVQSGGTTGRLIHDERLYQDLTTAIAELRALVTDMRENPRKYFKVSVF